MNSMEMKRKKRMRANAIFNGTVTLLSVVALIPLLLILFHIAHEGLSSLRWDFFINLPKPVGEQGGGIAHGIIGSLMLVGMASIMAIPVGVSGGIFLSQYRSGIIAAAVRSSVDIIQGIPSIVIGIAAYIWIVRPMGGFSALSGGVALGIMMVPVIVRSTEETLLLVPQTLKEASLALGAPLWLTILKVVVPAGMGGIISGILLSLARVAGETAPLLFTAFGNQFMNVVVTKPVSSLPHIIFNYAISPYQDWHSLAWGASCVLMILVLSVNIGTKIISHFWRT